MPDEATRAANKRRRFIVRSSFESYDATMLQRARTGFTGANAHRLAQLRDEDLAVADLPRARRFNDGFHHSIDLFIIHCQLKFHFWQKVDDVFCSSIELSVAFLTAKAFDLCHGNALYPHIRQGGADIVKFERFHDGDDPFHASALLISNKHSVYQRQTDRKCCNTAWSIAVFYCINSRVSCAGRANIKNGTGLLKIRAAGISHRRGSWLACRREMLLKRQKFGLARASEALQFLANDHVFGVHAHKRS